MDAKKYLIETLDYYKKRVSEDACTMEEINSVAKTLEENMQIHGTISDFANFYNVSESNVRATISRKLIAKPKRKLLYPFHKFAKIIPENWRKK
ncbi:MAG: hypothetical protein J6T35_03610 [Bacteroidales bacterium]|nr:hypothetical protein [Bacteroidales bacterium]